MGWQQPDELPTTLPKGAGGGCHDFLKEIFMGYHL